MSDTQTIARWEVLHSQVGSVLRYPSESVIRWLHRRFPITTPSMLLDIGTGAGRHALLMTRSGHCVYAVDTALNGISELVRWAAAEGVTVNASVASADALPFPDNSMDGVLSYGVMYYMPWTGMQAAVTEIRRVLKPGGSAFVQLRSDADSRAQTGEHLDERHIRVTLPTINVPWRVEEGMIQTLVGRKDIKLLFSDFAVCQIDRVTVTRESGRFIDDDWIIELER